MTNHKQRNHTHTTSFHQSRSLIFQFFLEEFCQANLEISQLKHMFEVKQQLALEPLKIAISKLTGPIHELSWCWNYEQGTLLKLKHHSTAFIATSHSRLAKYAQLERLSTILWKISIDIMHLITQMELKKSLQTQTHALKKKILQLLSAFHQLTHTVNNLLREFSNDEMVIFYLLRNKTTFETIYGEGYLKQLFFEIHPEGLLKTALRLKKNFISRGHESVGEQFYAKLKEVVA